MALPADFFYFTRAVDGTVTIWQTPASPVFTPSDAAAHGLTVTGRRPCLVRFKGELFVVGSWSRPVYYPTRDPLWVPAGIRQPPQQITVAAAGVGPLLGTALCYITYQHRAGGVVLAESNPSNLVQVALAGNLSRVWGNLATPAHEKRVTHVAGYASVNGSSYRQAFLMPYGASSYAEGLLPEQLTIEGPSSNYLPPTGVAFAAVFANRMWYANTAEYPYRIWFSAAGEAQYVDLASFRDTPDRDDITGIAPCQGVLVVFTLERAYAIRPSGSTFVIERLDSSFGCVSHFGCVEIHNKLWFPSQDGIAIYDGGGFRFVMKDMRPYWQRDYLEHPTPFFDSFAVNEKIGKNYFLLTPRPQRDAFEDWEPGLVAYVGNYLNFEPTMGGSSEQPDWSLDLRDRIDYSAFYGLDNRLYFGGEDGNLRVEEPENADDDADAIQKEALIEHGVLLFQEPGDDVEQGKTLQQLWVYTESEYTAWSCYVLMGDEWATEQFEPDNIFNNWKIDVPASGLVQVIPDPLGGSAIATYLPETVHNLGPEGVAGRGLALRIRATAPVKLRYRGYGGAWAAGPAPRKEGQIQSFFLLGP